MGFLLLIVLLVLLAGSAPLWPHSAGWGYYPSGGISVLLLIVILLVVFGRL